jgi:2-oxoglutarate ferredoxin oxidoreductase subunit gamma
MRPNVEESILSAGFGGQGIMLLGKVLANAGMEAGLHVTWLPSYGAEVRGGTAYSMVRISSEPIGSPFVKEATAAFIMNEPSLEKFEKRIKPGGLLILNTSIASQRARRDDLEVVEVPLTDEAIRLGNVRVANMIAVGIFMTRRPVFDKGALECAIRKMAVGYENRIPINLQAVERGIALAGRP